MTTTSNQKVPTAKTLRMGNLPKSISKSTRPVEIDMPANCPEVIAHDTESTYRESIMRYGLKPGGFGRRTRNEHHFYEIPTRLFEGRRGRSAEWRNHKLQDGNHREKIWM